MTSEQRVPSEPESPGFPGQSLRRVWDEKRLIPDELNREHLRLLAEASNVFFSSLDYMTTLRTVAHLAVPAAADWCFIDLINEQGDLQRLAATHVDPAKEALALDYGKRYPPDLESEASVAAALQHRESRLIPLVTNEMLERGSRDAEHLRILRELGLRSVISVPLISRDRVLGIITFVHAESERIYGEDDLLFVEHLARRAAVAIDNAQLYRSAQDALQLREEFLSIASHELKTPLTALTLQIQLLRRAGKGLPEGTLATRLNRTIVGAERQVTRLNKLTNNLLDVSRIGLGHLSLESEPVDLSQLASEVASRFEEELRGAGSTISIQAGSPVVGIWDHTRLDQVLTNLISNAVKYGQGNPIDVMVSADVDTARLTVRDHGVGIAPEDLSRVFNRFERLAPTKNYGGLGLGLYITRRIVEAQDGTIRVESLPGEGSSFTVELPRHPISP